MPVVLPKLKGNHEQKMCGSKHRHFTDLEAYREKDRLQQKTGLKMNAYFCPYCHHWHVGRARVAEPEQTGAEA